MYTFHRLRGPSAGPRQGSFQTDAPSAKSDGSLKPVPSTVLVRGFQSRSSRCFPSERGEQASTRRCGVNGACQLLWLLHANTSSVDRSRTRNWETQWPGMDWAAELEITSKKVTPRTFTAFCFRRPCREQPVRALPRLSSRATDFQLLPRLGRRSTQSTIQEEPKSDDDLLDSPVSLSSGKSAQPPVAPPRTRKTGWGDELKSGK